jgi:hypothetical protein
MNEKEQQAARVIVAIRDGLDVVKSALELKSHMDSNHILVNQGGLSSVIYNCAIHVKNLNERLTEILGTQRKA